MNVQTHPLPAPAAMIGGLARDPGGKCLWLGLAGVPGMVARFDLDSRVVVTEDIEGLFAGYSYVHRSIVPAPDGSLFVGATWLMGIQPTGERPKPFKPGGFSAVLTVMRWLGSMLSSCRIIKRSPSGEWSKVADARYMSADLLWDDRKSRLLRLMPRGLMAHGDEGESLVAPSQGGFVHQAAMGAQGQTLGCNDDGIVFLRNEDGRQLRLGDLGDVSSSQRAAPGIDGLIRVGEHHLVGGTRNRARPFVVDLRAPSLTVLQPLPTAPRLSALAAGPDGKVYFASGVGKVGLYQLDVQSLQVRPLMALEAMTGLCHHIHDMVCLPDGRIFMGEFYPLDVPEPPWPNRPCALWEVSLP